ncbi:hypothetical protein PAAG_06758 [Paracoccidioides lutzii Pb01]|uniref:Uncharacterized protein n=1 Tax=Paracoccidioides lutzii (strain ATCC MYA-826 / Pb01) TaxID=502779 RepID=C1H7L7_PARBA|nr:hypothetical protein PAAG_06758 [Paracoccidioides lutzii Pb01]EEH36340.2 hypothetical protein PAAG_06758 [Paracoccidioides lutzii Pb01]
MKYLKTQALKSRRLPPSSYKIALLSEERFLLGHTQEKEGWSRGKQQEPETHKRPERNDETEVKD